MNGVAADCYRAFEEFWNLRLLSDGLVCRAAANPHGSAVENPGRPEQARKATPFDSPRVYSTLLPIHHAEAPGTARMCTRTRRPELRLLVVQVIVVQVIIMILNDLQTDQRLTDELH